MVVLVLAYKYAANTAPALAHPDVSTDSLVLQQPVHLCWRGIGRQLLVFLVEKYDE